MLTLSYLYVWYTYIAICVHIAEMTHAAEIRLHGWEMHNKHSSRILAQMTKTGVHPRAFLPQHWQISTP